MIFVSVGMHHQGFDRLIRAMDDLDTSLGEPVVMQIGASSYEPRNARYFRFAGNDEVESLMEAARVVVIHCGVGSIISALRHRVPLVVVPRLKRFREFQHLSQVPTVGTHQAYLHETIPKENAWGMSLHSQSSGAIPL